MKRAVSETLLTAQTFWERYEVPILVILGAVWMGLCIHVGASR